MSTFKSHEESYHRCSQAVNRHINGLQLGKVEAVAAINLPVDLEEAEQHVRNKPPTGAPVRIGTAVAIHPFIRVWQTEYRRT